MGSLASYGGSRRPGAKRIYATSGNTFVAVGVASPTGQRYLNHTKLGWNILLFTRAHKLNELGTAPYIFLGPATYVEHKGEHPIAITWRLEHPMSPYVFHAARVVA